MRDVAIQAKTLPAPQRSSFDRDIRPIFERLTKLQWVNKGFADAFGWGGWRNLATPEWLLRLSHNNPNDRELRQTIANEFRVLTRDSWAQQTLPWNYGDAMNIPPVETPRQNSSLTGTQLGMLQQWASGDFDADYDPARQPPRHLADIRLVEQPAMLDRASMEFCLADAFHPGCEMTWPMRFPSMYMGPFRVAHADKGWIEPSFGAELIPDTLHLDYGPTHGQLPGGITRWMAVPWQTDTASCLSGYQSTYDPYVPTFWPAHVPNQVLSHDNYKIVMDKGRPLAERLTAFANRASWIRPLGNKGYTDQINNMIHIYGDLGVVEHQPGPGDPEFPAYMEVENLPSHTHARLTAMAKSERAIDGEAAVPATSQIDLTGIDKVHRFPHGLHKW
jgi:L-lysine epsilon oxidase C-terminal domain